MSSEYTEPDPEFTVQEERLQFRSEKKRQKDTARLIWASKPRREPSPKDLEFQTAEEVYPNKATGNLTSFFDSGEDEISSQPNRLIWGDNLLVMQALLAQGYEGQIDLIYIDPPFNTGENFNFPNEVKIGRNNYEREMPMNERLAYSDTWERGIDSFLDMMYPRLQLMRRLLSENGSILVHLDWHAGHYIKILLDEIFGNANFLNEIIWQRSSAHNDSKRATSYGAIHDTIYWYTKNPRYIWNTQFAPYDEKYILKAYQKFDPKIGKKFKTSDLTANNPGYSYEWKGVKPSTGRYWAYSEKRMEELEKNNRIYYSKTGFPYYMTFGSETG